MSPTNLQNNDPPRSGAELFYILSSECTYQDMRFPEFSERLIEDCVNWIEAICSNIDVETANADERAEWLELVERVVRARNRANESTLTSLNRLSEMLNGKLSQWQQLVLRGSDWWILAGKVPTEPWSWIPSGIATGELRVDLPDATIEEVIWRWFSAWLHPDDLSFIKLQVHNDAGAWGKIYLQVLRDVCRFSNIMELPIPLSYLQVTRFPTPTGDVVVNRTEQGVIVQPPDKASIELFWNQDDRILYPIEAIAGEYVEIHYRRIQPNANIEAQASLSALSNLVSEPDTPFAQAFEIIKAVASFFLGSSRWSHQIREVAQVFQEVNEIIEEEEWQHVARAVQARVMLESISVRYLSPELDELVTRMDQAMAFASDAVLTIPQETYEELVEDMMPSPGAWWSARRDLEMDLPHGLLKRALSIEPEPDFFPFPEPASLESPLETLERIKREWDQRVEIPGQFPELFSAASDDLRPLTLFEDEKIKVFFEAKKLFFQLHSQAFQAEKPTVFFRITNGPDVKPKALRHDTYVFDLTSPHFQQPSPMISLIMKDGDDTRTIEFIKPHLHDYIAQFRSSATEREPNIEEQELSEAYGKALYDACLYQGAKKIWKLDIPISQENIVRLDRITESKKALPQGVYFPVASANLCLVLKMRVKDGLANASPQLSADATEAVRNAQHCALNEIRALEQTVLHCDLRVPSRPTIDGGSLGLAAALAMLELLTECTIDRPVICTGEMSDDGLVRDVGSLAEKVKASLEELGDTDGLILVPMNPEIDDRRIKTVSNLKEAIQFVWPGRAPLEVSDRRKVSPSRDLPTFFWSQYYRFSNLDLAEYQNEAEQMLRYLAQKDDKKARFMLGIKLITGDGFTQNPSEGEALLNALAESGEWIACSVLGAYKLNGIGVAHDEKEGEALLKKAFYAGEADALVTLASYYLVHKSGKDKLKVEEYLRKAINQGSSLGAAILAEVLVLGVLGPERKAEGLQLFVQNVERKNPEAMALLGNLIFLGQIENFRDYNAEHLLREAMGAGEKLFSKAFLGNMLAMQALPEKSKEGVELLQSGIKEGIPLCMWNFGDMLLKGIYVSQNIKEGVNLLKRARSYGLQFPLEPPVGRKLFQEVSTNEKEENEKYLKNSCLDAPYLLKFLTSTYLEEVDDPNYIERVNFLIDLAEKGILKAKSSKIAWNIMNNRSLWPVLEQNLAWKKLVEIFLLSFRNLEDKDGGINTTFILRREDVTLEEEISITELLQPGLDENQPFAIVNDALCHAAGFERKKDWLAAEISMAKLDVAGAENVVQDCWHDLAKLNDPEGHLVIGWLVHLDLITDPDKWSLEERLNKARMGKWADIPHWED